jgi:hypothetical protein
MMAHRPRLVAPWCLALSMIYILVGTSNGFVVPQKQQGKSVFVPTNNDVRVRGGVIFNSRPDHHGLQMKLPFTSSNIDGPERTRKHDVFHRDM